MLNIFKEIKWFVQRGRRGYSDADTWDFDSYLNNMIPCALRRLKNKHMGCPSEFYDASKLNDECHKWSAALEKMARGFESAEFIKNARYHKWVDAKDKPGFKTLETDLDALNNAKKDMEIGLALFAENYLNLWD